MYGVHGPFSHSIHPTDPDGALWAGKFMSTGRFNLGWLCQCDWACPYMRLRVRQVNLAEIKNPRPRRDATSGFLCQWYFYPIDQNE